MSGMNAFGTRLERADSGGEEFEAIANVTNISGPGIEREEIDLTHHESEDGWMEFVGGLKDPGEVELDVNYRPSDHDYLLEDFDSDELREYRIVFPDKDSTRWEFKAFLTGFEPEMPHDDKAEASITFKVTGKPKLSSAGDDPSS